MISNDTYNKTITGKVHLWKCVNYLRARTVVVEFFDLFSLAFEAVNLSVEYDGRSVLNL